MSSDLDGGACDARGAALNDSCLEALLESMESPSFSRASIESITQNHPDSPSWVPN